MDDYDSLPTTIPAGSTAAALAAAINQAANGKWRVVLTRDGKPIAAIVPIEDYDDLEAADDAEDEKLAAAALAEWRAAGCPPGIPMEDIIKRYEDEENQCLKAP